MHEHDASEKRDWERVVRRATALPPGPTLVAYALHLYASADGRDVFPGVALLSQTTRLSERAVRRHLATLRGYGLIQKVSAGGSKSGYADRYRLTTTVEGLHALALVPLPGAQPVDNPVDNPVGEVNPEILMGQDAQAYGPTSAALWATTGPPPTSTNQVPTTPTSVVTSPPAGEGDAKIIFLGSRRAVR